MIIDRRRALALLGLAGAPTAAKAGEGTPRFAYGVASGDPGPDRLIIWTHVAGVNGAPVPVKWMVAEDDGMKRIVARGTAVASAERDHTVKVDVTGLKPGTAYHYRFTAGGTDSPTGHARTLPVGPTRDLVLAAATCSLYQGGYFNAYKAIADLPRVDVVLHLGDYIYEYDRKHYGFDTGQALNRWVEPDKQCVTLADYRARFACHRAEPELQAAHARAAWICIWDDHETANDSWSGGAQDHHPDTEGDWAARKAAAVRAYYEWMPIREPAKGKAKEAIWRSFQFGDLATLVMLETRLTARTHQLDYDKDIPVVGGKPDIAAFRAKLNDPERRQMGPGQEAWLKGELAASVKAGRPWQIIGNQVVMARTVAPDFETQYGPAKWAQMVAEMPEEYSKRIGKIVRLGRLGLPVSLDGWDGYPADRQRVYDIFEVTKARPIVLSGDSHAFWANQLEDDHGREVAVEFGATGITSPGAGDALKGVPVNEGMVRQNREVKFNDQAAKGFVLLTLTHEGARGELMAVSTIMERTFTTGVLKAFEVKAAPGGGTRLA